MNATFIATLAALMIGVGVGFIYLVLRENTRPVPRGGVQWAAVGVSGLLVVFATVLLALTLAPGPDEAAIGPEPLPSEMDRPAPDFPFRFVSNEAESTLDAYRGQVVLLNFWATWCAPCLQEMPELNRLQADYRDEGLVVVTISDEPREDLLAFEEFLPLRTVSGYIPSPTMMPQPFQRTMAVRPATFVIDRDGTIRRFIKGAGTYDFFEQAITPFL
ncbi:MAG: TlpA disulfide reductase family protein [Rhodothermales bacterium]|nr:TlpA disulfide reductase family protein [Rhodothermales bacterium]